MSQLKTSELPKFIAVEGAIGVGKTTLCKRIAEHFSAELVLESPNDNPFLEDFYQDPKRFAFKTQVFFLVQRVEQLKQLYKTVDYGQLFLSDYVLAKELIFAELTLDEQEFSLYKKLYEQLSNDLPKPDLVIYLQAPIETLVERIRTRARNYEQKIELSYLTALHEGYLKFFGQYQDSSLIIINNDAINIVNNAADVKQLIDFIQQNPKGRHYFNPLSES